jgi:hypothetical protein
MQLLAAILLYYVLTGIGWILTSPGGIAPGVGLLLLVLLASNVLFRKAG